MSFKDEIRKITQLQEIDSQIYILEQEKCTGKPAMLEVLKSGFNEKKESFTIFEEKVKQLQLKKKEKEVDLASEEEKLAKARTQLYQLKTNKEYQAKLNEIASHKADISVSEEEMIEVLDEFETADKEFQAQKEILEKEEKEVQEKESEISGQIKDINAQISNLTDKRKKQRNEIAVKHLNKYEQLLKARQGLAITAVNNSNCGACHLRLTHQKINEIKMLENLVLCESCVRILYIPEDIE